MHTTMTPGKLYRLRLEELPFWKQPDTTDPGAVFKRGTVFMFLEVVATGSKSEVSSEWYRFIAPTGEVLGRYVSRFTADWFEPISCKNRNS